MKILMIHWNKSNKKSLICKNIGDWTHVDKKICLTARHVFPPYHFLFPDFPFPSFPCILNFLPLNLFPSPFNLFSLITLRQNEVSCILVLLFMYRLQLLSFLHFRRFARICLDTFSILDFICLWCVFYRVLIKLILIDFDPN